MKNKEKIIEYLKNSLISISISFVMILSLEVIYRTLRVNNFSFSLTNNEILKFKKIAFDNKYSYEEIIELSASEGVGSGIQYQPWIQIGNATHNNKFSIVENGNRKTKTTKIKCDNQKIIWFFGGSTTYGTGVKWNETLPTMFVEVLDENNICAKVVNFGVPFHYSLQESLYMASEIAKGERAKPDFVFFIDGVNDFIQVGSSIKKEPFFTPKLEGYFGSDAKLVQNLNQPIFSLNFTFIDYLKRKLKLENIVSNYSKPENLSDKEVINKIVSTINLSNQFRSNICQIYQIKCFQFLQPAPYINYSNNFGEILTGNQVVEKQKLFLNFYEMILATKDLKANKGIKIYDLSKAFLNYKNGIPYVDSFHYSPRANKKLAKNIFKIVFKNF